MSSSFILSPGDPKGESELWVLGPLPPCCVDVRLSVVLFIHYNQTQTSSFELFKGTRCDRDLGRPVESFHFVKITDKQ